MDEPPKLRKLEPPPTDIAETLQDVLKCADGYEGIIVLAMGKDGMARLRTSTLSTETKCFLTMFLLSFFSQGLQCIEDDDGSPG